MDQNYVAFFPTWAYSTNLVELSEEELDLLKGIDKWILECLSTLPNKKHALELGKAKENNFDPKELRLITPLKTSFLLVFSMGLIGTFSFRKEGFFLIRKFFKMFCEKTLVLKNFFVIELNPIAYYVTGFDEYLEQFNKKKITELVEGK